MYENLTQSELLAAATYLDIACIFRRIKAYHVHNMPKLAVMVAEIEEEIASGRIKLEYSDADQGVVVA